MRILVAEDNFENREILERRLGRQGFTVLTAVDGAEAIDVAITTQPDLILMDISMPIMSGTEATQKIRTIDSIKDIPIIALTAHAMEGDREKCVAAGCTDFATKPVDFKSLIVLINSLLNAPDTTEKQKTA